MKARLTWSCILVATDRKDSKIIIGKNGEKMGKDPIFNISVFYFFRVELRLNEEEQSLFSVEPNLIKNNLIFKNIQLELLAHQMEHLCSC